MVTLNRGSNFVGKEASIRNLNKSRQNFAITMTFGPEISRFLIGIFDVLDLIWSF